MTTSIAAIPDYLALGAAGWEASTSNPIEHT